MFKTQKHSLDLYNTLLGLSRNIFFYKELGLPDTFSTRIHLIFFHFSIMMIVCKRKNQIFSQKSYDSLFLSIENNLREQGLGDVSVNAKMKNLNKILYDIVIKIDFNQAKNDNFKINTSVIIKYFDLFIDTKNDKFIKFERYLLNFYKFCFELSLENMVKEAIKFRN